MTITVTAGWASFRSEAVFVNALSPVAVVQPMQGRHWCYVKRHART